MFKRKNHFKDGFGTTSIGHAYTYDGADRTASHAFSIAQGVPPTTATLAHAYDALGRLSSMTRPFNSSAEKDVAYTYDLHGWMTGVTTNSFCEELFYADGPGAPRYGGDVSAMRWSSYEHSPKRGYRFSYDDAGRLTQASYGEGDALTSNADRFSEGVQYDAHGNVTRIVRRGRTSAYAYGLMDDLTLAYDGDRVDNTDYLITSTSQQITYNPYGKAALIVEGDSSQVLFYGPDKTRWLQVTDHYSGKGDTPNSHSFHSHLRSDKDFCLQGWKHQIVSNKTKQLWYESTQNHLFAAYDGHYDDLVFMS